MFVTSRACCWGLSSPPLHPIAIFGSPPFSIRSDDSVCKGLFLGSSLLGPTKRNAEPLLFKKNPARETKTPEPKWRKRLWIHERTLPSRSETPKYVVSASLEPRGGLRCIAFGVCVDRNRVRSNGANLGSPISSSLLL